MSEYLSRYAVLVADTELEEAGHIARNKLKPLKAAAPSSVSKDDRYLAVVSSLA